MAATAVSPTQRVSSSGLVSLTQFVAKFDQAWAEEPDPWAERLVGGFEVTKMLKLLFPIPMSTAGYEETTGDPKFRSIMATYATILQRDWQDGVEEKESVLDSPDFIGWGAEPLRMAQAAKQLPNTLIATLLEANGTCWDGVAFFNANHPVNYYDTGAGVFSNTTGSSALSETTLATAMADFRAIKKPDGLTSMGLRLTHIVVPPELEVTALKLAESQYVTSGVDNFFRGRFQVEVADDLTDANDWFALALNKPGLVPWGGMRHAGPNTTPLDHSSELYKVHRKLGVNSTFSANGVLLLPHVIHRYQG